MDTTGMPRGCSRQMALLPLLACLLALLATPAGASSGDAAPAFRACWRQCSSQGGACAGASAACSPLCGPAGSAVPAALRAWRWDCSADCGYLCMWGVEAGAARPQKYHGKWPFARWAGMQEPASVLLSLANLAVHAAGLRRCLALLAAARAKGSSGGGGGTYASLWLAQVGLSINAWLWSAVFHGRDTRATERLDYFSAGGLVAFNLYFTILRVFGVRPAGPAAGALALLIGGCYARHVRFMSTVLFDYGWHVKLCIAAGAAQSLLWLTWALGGPGRRHPGRRLLLLFVVAINACSLLEVFDFPPIYSVFDAHAAWHLSTIPLFWAWNRFIYSDLTSAQEARFSSFKQI